MSGWPSPCRPYGPRLLGSRFTSPGSECLKAGMVAVRGTLRDMRMCKSIGVDLGTGAAAMDKLWGRPFSAERDSRAEPDANAQRKGQISRQLKAELQKVVNDGDD